MLVQMSKRIDSRRKLAVGKGLINLAAGRSGLVAQSGGPSPLRPQRPTVSGHTLSRKACGCHVRNTFALHNIPQYFLSTDVLMDLPA